MSIIKIVRRNIMFKPLQSLVACCVVMASIAMAELVLLLADGVHSGLTAAAERRRRGRRAQHGDYRCSVTPVRPVRGVEAVGVDLQQSR